MNTDFGLFQCMMFRFLHAISDLKLQAYIDVKTHSLLGYELHYINVTYITLYISISASLLNKLDSWSALV